MQPDAREVEATLLISSTAADAVAARAAELRELPGFRLLHRATLSIRDTYFDLDDRSLEAGRIALRVRELDGSALLALKQDSRAAGGVTERLELEAPWSEASLARVIEELAKRGIQTRPPAPRAAAADPPAALVELGLAAIQERETSRAPRDVVPEGDGEPVAEMAVDLVSYRLAGGAARLYEIEVEARGDGEVRDVEEIVTRLTEEFRGELREWRYGKLATGLAIQALLARAERADLVDPSGTLSAVAYERVEASLEAEGAGF